MPIYIGDYLADTGHLTTTQHGAYLLLLMHYWRKRELPEDDKQLSAIAKLPLRIWLDSKETLQAFFHDGWKHKRIESELGKRQEVSDKRADAGSKGGKSKAAPKEAIATDGEAFASVLLKQNGSMTHTQLQKKDSEAKASGAVAPPIDPSKPEREYFARGREVLGASAGGQLAKLLKANGGNVSLSRSTLELAATKHKPAEFFARAVQPQSNGPPSGRGGFASVLMDKHMERQNDTSDSEPHFLEH